MTEVLCFFPKKAYIANTHSLPFCYRRSGLATLISLPLMWCEKWNSVTKQRRDHLNLDLH